MLDRSIARTEAQKTAERLTCIHELGLLDGPSEAAFDELVSLASTICNAPLAAISVICDKRQWIRSQIGVEQTDIPLEESFCWHTV